MFSAFYLLLGVATILAATSLALERRDEEPSSLQDAQKLIGAPVRELPGETGGSWRIV